MPAGPILIFDKSTLQMLDRNEAMWLNNFFESNITPLFFVETLADLEKQVRSGRTPEQVVGNLAYKTPDMQSNSAAHHLGLLAAELSGEQQVAMDGKPLVCRCRIHVAFCSSPDSSANWIGLRCSGSLEKVSDKPKFSIRVGVQPTPTPMREEAPQGLRYFLWKYIERKHLGYPWIAAEIFEDFLRTPGLRNKFFNPHDLTAWTRLYAYIEGFKWWQVYDFIEAIFAREQNQYERRTFLEELNKVLAAENTCWRLEYTGEITYKGTESFEASVNTASAVLARAGRNTVW